MNLLPWAVVGLLLGAAFLRFATLGDAARERRILAAGLVVASLVYVAFALWEGAGTRLLLELGGAALFAVPAFAGLRRMPLLLAAGWAGHTFWDALLHVGGVIDGAEAYAALCIGFDPLVAVVTGLRVRRLKGRRWKKAVKGV